MDEQVAEQGARRSVIQDWVTALPMMQQTVLLTAVRGPDGLPKHPTKYLLRWYRRSILLSALDGKVITDPVEPIGGSFNGPSVEVHTDGDWRPPMDGRVTESCAHSMKCRITSNCTSFTPSRSSATSSLTY